MYYVRGKDFRLSNGEMLELKSSKKKKILLLMIVLAIAQVLCACAACAASFAATEPEISIIADFILGSRGNVRWLTVWGEDGMVVYNSSPRKDDTIIAWDVIDAQKLKIKKTDKRLRVLYKKFPMERVKFKSVIFDPAILPFVSARIMNVIVDEDREHYLYYQRRLAEFQSRIDSAVDIGSRLLKDAKILDVTGASGIWVRAVAPGAVRPPEKAYSFWNTGSSAVINAVLNEAAARGWLILTDVWTPQNILLLASAYPSVLFLQAPMVGGDYFSYLYDIFLEINGKMGKNKGTK